MKNEKGNVTKSALLDAFNLTENREIREACRAAGKSLSTFYFHYYKDADFRRAVLESKRDHLTERANAVQT